MQQPWLVRGSSGDDSSTVHSAALGLGDPVLDFLGVPRSGQLVIGRRELPCLIPPARATRPPPGHLALSAHFSLACARVTSHPPSPYSLLLNPLEHPRERQAGRQAERAERAERVCLHLHFFLCYCACPQSSPKQTSTALLPKKSVTIHIHIHPSLLTPKISRPWPPAFPQKAFEDRQVSRRGPFTNFFNQVPTRHDTIQHETETITTPPRGL